MKKFLAGLGCGVVLMTAANYINPYFPIILFCGDSIGRLWGAARCF